MDFLVEVGRQVAPKSKRKVYNFKKADLNQFRDLLAALPWNCCSGGSVDEDWLKFRDLLLSVADQCIPKVTLRPRKQMNWLNDSKEKACFQISQMITERQRF